MSDVTSERLCKAPLHLRVAHDPYEATQARNLPRVAEEIVERRMKPQLMTALERSGSPCYDCKHKKFESHEDMITLELRVALHCGLGPNPVCPDMVKAMWHNDLEFDSIGRSMVGDFEDQYMSHANSVMPTWVPPKSRPAPRPKDQPATSCEEAW